MGLPCPLASTCLRSEVELGRSKCWRIENDRYLSPHPQLPPCKVKVSEECEFPTDRLSCLLQLRLSPGSSHCFFSFLLRLGLRTWGLLSPRCFPNTCWFFHIVPSLHFIKSPLLRGHLTSGGPPTSTPSESLLLLRFQPVFFPPPSQKVSSISLLLNSDPYFTNSKLLISPPPLPIPLLFNRIIAINLHERNTP